MRIRLLVFSFVLFVASAALAQPNFSGIWKMNPEKSDWGPQSAPLSAEYVIRHVGATISFNYTVNGKTSRIDLIPDNEERITSSTEETAVWSRAYWSGEVLVIESRERKRFGTQANTGSSFTSRWSLSADGKEFVVERTIRNPAGMEVSQRVVFDRQPIPPKSQQ